MSKNFGSKRLVVGAQYGLRDWLAQRATAMVMALFTIVLLVQLKTTALVSVIGLQDLVYNAFTAGRSTGQLFTFMAAAFVIYLALTAISDLALRAAVAGHDVGPDHPCPARRRDRGEIAADVSGR